ncbi:MAG TPA: rhodanese-like domain-containing protein [Gemmataceae bacterium]|nr:rhodanese-like domain-containing protein [Gemmataceae bacterium]
MPRQMHPETLAKKLAAGEPVYLLDVREPWEHATARLPDSTLIPLGELPERIAEMDPPPGAAVVVYCHHGIRSLSGAAILEMNGIPDAFSLWGGIEAWSQLVDPSVPRY